MNFLIAFSVYVLLTLARTPHPVTASGDTHQPSSKNHQPSPNDHQSNDNSPDDIQGIFDDIFHHVMNGDDGSHSHAPDVDGMYNDTHFDEWQSAIHLSFGGWTHIESVVENNDSDSESDIDSDSDEGDDVHTVVKSIFRIYAKRNYSVSFDDNGDDDDDIREIRRYFNLSSIEEVKDHVHEQFEIIKNISVEIDIHYNFTHGDCVKNWRKCSDVSSVYENVVEFSRDDTVSLINSYNQLQKTKLKQQLNALNLTLIELLAYKDTLRSQIASGKITLLKDVLASLLANSTFNATLNGTLVSCISRLNSLDDPITQIRYQLGELRQKVEEFNDTYDHDPVLRTIGEVRACIRNQSHSFFQRLSQSLQLCDDSVRNVTVNKTKDDDAQFVVSATYDSSLSSEDDIEVLVVGAVVNIFKVNVEEVYIERKTSKKRGLLNDASWGVSFTDSDLTINVTDEYDNLTDVEMPTLDDHCVANITELATEMANQWIEETKQLSVNQLRALLVLLQNSYDSYIKEKNETRHSFDSYVSSFKSSVSSYWTATKNIVSSYDNGPPNNDDTNDDTDDESDDDYSIAEQMGKNKVERYNNTVKTVLYEKQQVEIDYLNKLLLTLGNEINLVKLYISLDGDKLNQTLFNQIAALETQLVRSYVQEYLQNATFDNYDSLLDKWMDVVNDVDDYVNNTMKWIKNKEFKSVPSIKEQWKAKKEIMINTIKQSIESYLNCSVEQSNFDDLESDMNDFSLKWVLQLSNSKTSPKSVSSVIKNILFMESAVQKSEINVNTLMSSKRSTTMTTTAVMKSSTSTDTTSAAANTDYIIGGVVSGILLIGIIIALVLILRNKSAEKA